MRHRTLAIIAGTSPASAGQEGSCSTSVVCVRATSSVPMKIWAWKSIGTGYEFATTMTTTAPAGSQGRHPDLCTMMHHGMSSKSSSRREAGSVGSGVREKYIFQKMGVLHSVRCTPGIIPVRTTAMTASAIFARDMDMTMNNPVLVTTDRPVGRSLPGRQMAIPVITR